MTKQNNTICNNTTTKSTLHYIYECSGSGVAVWKNCGKEKNEGGNDKRMKKNE